MIKQLKCMLIAAIAITGLAACGPVDSALDCHAICGRYASCFDSKYDTGACETRCRDNAAKDSTYKRKADTCNACINDRACASATFSCTADCASVVP
jgi:hypothetical protein